MLYLRISASEVPGSLLLLLVGSSDIHSRSSFLLVLLILDYGFLFKWSGFIFRNSTSLVLGQISQENISVCFCLALYDSTNLIPFNSKCV